MNNLRDPVWLWFISVIISFFGILVTFFKFGDSPGIIFLGVAVIFLSLLYLRIRPTRAIFFRVMSDTTVLSVEKEEEVKGDLSVLYKGNGVEGDIQLVILKLWNAGYDSILQDQYNISINMNFGQEAKVLSVQVQESKPSTIKKDSNCLGVLETCKRTGKQLQ